MREPSAVRRVQPNDGLLAAVLTLAALALYLRTASPTFAGLDAAELAIASYTLGIPHATGFPLFVLLGWLFTHALPIGEVVYRTTIMTALFAALTVGTAYVILRQLRLRRLAAMLACATFAASYYQWSSAVATKEHSLHDFLLALLLLLLVRWQKTDRFAWLLAAAGIFGLSLSNHMSAALYGPALALFVVLRRRPSAGQLAALVAAAVAGVLPYLYVPLAYLRGPRFSIAGVYDPAGIFHPVDLSTPAGMVWLITGRQLGRLFLSVPVELLPSSVMDVAYWLWTSFFGAGVVLGVFGLASLRRRNVWFFGLVLAIATCHVAFFATYAVPDRDAMFVPLYLLWTLPLGFGIASLLAVIRRRAFIRIAAAGLGTGLAVCIALSFPRIDRSWDRQPEQWAAIVMDRLPAGSIVLGRWQTSGPLQYLSLVKGVRPDVKVIDRFLISEPSIATLVGEQLGKRPIAVDADDNLPKAGLAGALPTRPLLSPDEAWLSSGDQRYPMLLLSRRPA